MIAVFAVGLFLGHDLGDAAVVAAMTILPALAVDVGCWLVVDWALWLFVVLRGFAAWKQLDAQVSSGALAGALWAGLGIVACLLTLRSIRAVARSRKAGTGAGGDGLD